MASEPRLRNSENATMNSSQHFGPTLAHEQLTVTAVESMPLHDFKKSGINHFRGFAVIFA